MTWSSLFQGLQSSRDSRMTGPVVITCGLSHSVLVYRLLIQARYCLGVQNSASNDNLWTFLRPHVFRYELDFRTVPATLELGCPGLYFSTKEFCLTPILRHKKSPMQPRRHDVLFHTRLWDVLTWLGGDPFAARALGVWSSVTVLVAGYLQVRRYQVVERNYLTTFINHHRLRPFLV